MYFCLLFISLVSGAIIKPPTASKSDGGRLIYRGGALYASDMLDEIDKVHMVISIPTCECVAAADVQKINQLDYMLDRGHLFSYSVYVNEGGFHDRSDCPLTRDKIQQRTDLQFGTIGGDGLFEGTIRPHFSKRVEGVVLQKGIDDFLSNTYIKDNSKEIFGTDKSGGVLFTQGNVELRPCMLFPWYMPWIYDDYNTRHLVNITTADERVPYYEAQDAALFNEIVADMIHAKVIKTKHLANLEDNTGSGSVVEIFSFQSLFIPHRFVHEFLSLLKPFADTALCPYVYVPYILQIMFDRNEWLHFKHETHNETLRLGQYPLLIDCVADTVEEMHVFDRAASDLHYYSYNWCGGDSFYIVVEKVVTEIETYTGMSVYRVLFYVLLSAVIVCVACIFRRPIFDCWRSIYRTYTYKPVRTTYEMSQHPPSGFSSDSDEDEMVITTLEREKS